MEKERKQQKSGITDSVKLQCKLFEKEILKALNNTETLAVNAGNENFLIRHMLTALVNAMLEKSEDDYISIVLPPDTTVGSCSNFILDIHQCGIDTAIKYDEHDASFTRCVPTMNTKLPVYSIAFKKNDSKTENQ